MIEQQEVNRINTIIKDIDICVQKERIDDMIYSFIHIFNEISPELGELIGMKEKELELRKIIKDTYFMKRLILFYKIYESTEEGKLLFDERITDTPLYILEESLFEKILKLKMDIVQMLGKIKKSILIEDENDKEW